MMYYLLYKYIFENGINNWLFNSVRLQIRVKLIERVLFSKIVHSKCMLIIISVLPYAQDGNVHQINP